ncbi:MAG: hypothetical protein AB7F64_07315 [Gammaproteobacteria bacterium]
MMKHQNAQQSSDNLQANANNSDTEDSVSETAESASDAENQNDNDDDASEDNDDDASEDNDDDASEDNDDDASEDNDDDASEDNDDEASNDNDDEASNDNDDDVSAEEDLSNADLVSIDLLQAILILENQYNLKDQTGSHARSETIFNLAILCVRIVANTSDKAERHRLLKLAIDTTAANIRKEFFSGKNSILATNLEIISSGPTASISILNKPLNRNDFLNVLYQFVDNMFVHDFKDYNNAGTPSQNTAFASISRLIQNLIKSTETQLSDVLNTPSLTLSDKFRALQNQYHGIIQVLDTPATTQTNSNGWFSMFSTATAIPSKSGTFGQMHKALNAHLTELSKPVTDATIYSTLTSWVPQLPSFGR